MTSQKPLTREHATFINFIFILKRVPLYPYSLSHCFLSALKFIFTATQIVVVESSSSASPGIIAVAVILPVAVLTVIVVTITIFLVWYFRRRSRKLARANFTIEMMSTLYQVDNPLFDRVEALKPTGPHEKEFPLNSVTCVRELGEGAFGRVYQGMAKNIIMGEDSTTVAVKQLKVNTFEDNGVVVGEFFKG